MAHHDTDMVILSTFQRIRVLEFSASICQNQKKDIGKGEKSDGLLDGIKDRFHMLCFFAFKKISHHKGTGGKEK